MPKKQKNKNELMKIKEIEYETRIKRLYNIINERNEKIWCKLL